METLLGYQNRRRFTTKTNYYQYWVQNDLFDLVLVKTCGSLTSKKGNQQSIPIRFSDFPSLSANIEKRQFSHRYAIIQSGVGINAAPIRQNVLTCQPKATWVKLGF